MCVSLFTHLFTLFLLPVGIFLPTSPHSYPPIHSFSSSSRYISSNLSSLLPTYSLFFPFQSVYFFRPLLILTHLSQLFLLLVGIFPPTSPHSYPPIHSFSPSSGYFLLTSSEILPTHATFSFSSRYISSNLSSFLPTYSLFFFFQSVFYKICPKNCPKFFII